MNKDATGWVLCPSTKRPGHFYYFNVLTGEKAWTCASVPNSTPNESLTTPEHAAIQSQNSSSSLFGNVQFPRYIQNGDVMIKQDNVAQKSSWDRQEKCEPSQNNHLPKFITTWSENSQDRDLKFNNDMDMNVFRKDNVEVNKGTFYREPQVGLKCDISISTLKSLAKSEWYIVADLEVLFEDLDFLSGYIAKDVTCKLLTPHAVLVQISSLRRDGGGRATVARQLHQWLLEHSVLERDNSAEAYYAQDDSTDNLILQCCLRAMKQGLHVVLITKKKRLRNFAMTTGIHAYYINELKNYRENTGNNNIESNIFLQKANTFDPFSLSKCLKSNNHFTYTTKAKSNPQNNNIVQYNSSPEYLRDVNINKYNCSTNQHNHLTSSGRDNSKVNEWINSFDGLSLGLNNRTSTFDRCRNPFYKDDLAKSENARARNKNTIFATPVFNNDDSQQGILPPYKRISAPSINNGIRQDTFDKIVQSNKKTIHFKERIDWSPVTNNMSIINEDSFASDKSFSPYKNTSASTINNTTPQDTPNERVHSNKNTIHFQERLDWRPVTNNINNVREDTFVFGKSLAPYKNTSVPLINNTIPQDTSDKRAQSNKKTIHFQEKIDWRPVTNYMNDVREDTFTSDKSVGPYKNTSAPTINSIIPQDTSEIILHSNKKTEHFKEIIDWSPVANNSSSTREDTFASDKSLAPYKNTGAPKICNIIPLDTSDEKVQSNKKTRHCQERIDLSPATNNVDNVGEDIFSSDKIIDRNGKIITFSDKIGSIAVTIVNKSTEDNVDCKGNKITTFTKIISSEANDSNVDYGGKDSPSNNQIGANAFQKVRNNVEDIISDSDSSIDRQRETEKLNKKIDVSAKINWNARGDHSKNIIRFNDHVSPTSTKINSYVRENKILDQSTKVMVSGVMPLSTTVPTVKTKTPVSEPSTMVTIFNNNNTRKDISVEFNEGTTTFDRDIGLTTNKIINNNAGVNTSFATNGYTIPFNKPIRSTVFTNTNSNIKKDTNIAKTIHFSSEESMLFTENINNSKVTEDANVEHNSKTIPLSKRIGSTRINSKEKKYPNIVRTINVNGKQTYSVFVTENYNKDKENANVDHNSKTIPVYEQIGSTVFTKINSNVKEYPNIVKKIHINNAELNSIPFTVNESNIRVDANANTSDDNLNGVERMDSEISCNAVGATSIADSAKTIYFNKIIGSSTVTEIDSNVIENTNEGSRNTRLDEVNDTNVDHYDGENMELVDDDIMEVETELHQNNARPMNAYETIEIMLSSLRNALKLFYEFYEDCCIELSKGVSEIRKKQLRIDTEKRLAKNVEIMHKLECIKKRENPIDPEFNSDIAVQDPEYMSCIERCIEQVKIVESALKFVLEALGEN